METFGVIPFRFGAAAPEPISDKDLDFYYQVLSALYSEKIQFLNSNEVYSLAINLGDLYKNESITYQKIISRVQGWRSKPDILAVDIIPPMETLIPGRAELHIATALQFLGEQQNSLHFVVFVEEILAEKDAFNLLLASLVEQGRLILVDSNGVTAGRIEKDHRLPADYPALRHQICQDPLGLLELKMMRRRGHFTRPREEGGKHCFRFFYDGSECIREISHLIEASVKNRGGDKKPFLVYDCTESKWLEDAIITVAGRLQIVLINVGVLFDRPNLIPDEQRENGILFLPLVDTGATLEKILLKWREKISDSLPKIITVLTTRASDERKRIRRGHCADCTYELEYFLKVERGLEKTENCVLCELNVPNTSYDTESFELITSYDFWSMADEVGWKDEDYVPDTRDPLVTCPDFPKMVKENGAWLASKIKYQLLSIIGKEFPANPVLLICPDEDGARILSAYIQVLHEGLTVVRVPEDDFKVCRDPSSNLNEVLKKWELARPHWYVQITEASSVAGIAIVEEFCVSGGTRKAFLRLLAALDRKALAHLAIVDFNPPASKESGIPCFSLYAFDAISKI